MDNLLSDIEAFCKAHDLKESRFGREAVNDINFVLDLRNGREPRRKTVERVKLFMLTYGATQREAA